MCSLNSLFPAHWIDGWAHSDNYHTHLDRIRHAKWSYHSVWGMLVCVEWQPWCPLIQVSFVGIRDYAPSFSHTVTIFLFSLGDIYSPANNNFGTTLIDLFPNTQYTVSVFPVNGAGNGMPATSTVNTLNGELHSLSVCLEFHMFSAYLPPRIFILSPSICSAAIYSVPSFPTSCCCWAVISFWRGDH